MLLCIHMGRNSEHVISWRQRTKERIIQSFGGSCGICGYDKCQASLDLHHINPQEKEFGLGGIRANPMAWHKIVNELRKCVLLCKNCHGEFHTGLFDIPTDIRRFDESFTNYKELIAADQRKHYYNECPVCGCEKFHSNKTCSYKCSSTLTGKYDWESYDLHKLYFEDELSMNAISKIVGCSDVAVKKRFMKITDGKFQMRKQGTNKSISTMLKNNLTSSQ
jgi:hypothetical protein